MLKITQETINPTKALSLLAGSPGNRPIRKGHVAFLADQMLTGHWRPLSVVVLDERGQILDGHHRMHAIAISGTSQRFIVVRGANSADRDVLDVNIARTLGDKLAFAGVKNALARAALMRWCVNALAGAGAFVKIATVEGYERWAPLFAEGIDFATEAMMRSAANPLTRVAHVAGPIAFAWRRDSAAVREFAGLLVDHVAAKGSPAWLLHRALVRARMPGRDVAITRVSLWTLWAIEQHIAHRNPARLWDSVDWESFRAVYPKKDRDELGEYYARVQGMHRAARRRPLRQRVPEAA